MPAPPPSRSLGDLVVEHGLADRAAVDAAIEKQRRDARVGVFRRLGEVLIEAGILDAEQVTELLSLQGKRIAVCPVCLAQYNVDGETTSRCARCGDPLSPPGELRTVKVEDDLVQSSRRALEGASLDVRDGLLRGPPGASPRFGNYEILGEISRGGMGVVYKARQPGLDRVVALKVILAGQADQESVVRFRREARAVSRLRHPNIVGIHEVGEIDGVNFFCMDFIEGVTLDRAVTSDGLGPPEVAELFVKIAEAVAYAHKNGVVHRDLKPRNVIVDRRREPIVIDFGIARLQDLDGPAGTLTKSGEILGSPAYLAPEYLAGSVLDYDEACDVYSLGACLYHALAGRPPHADKDTIRIIRNAATLDAPPIRSIQRNLERRLATIVMTAVERDRAARYARASDLAEDLRRWLAGEEIAARSTPLLRWWRRVRTKVAVVLGLLVSFGLVGTSGWYANEIRRIQERHAAPDLEDRERQNERVVDLLLKLAESYLAAGRPAEAEREASEAIAVARGERLARAYLLRARAHRDLGRPKDAEEDERRSRER